MIFLSVAVLFAVAFAGFSVSIILFISSKRFLKGEIKRFTELLMFGSILLYFFTITQLLVEAFSLYGTFFDLLRAIFLYLSFTLYLLAADEMNRISKFLGFASEKTPKKLKRILTR